MTNIINFLLSEKQKQRDIINNIIIPSMNNIINDEFKLVKSDLINQIKTPNNIVDEDLLKEAFIQDYELYMIRAFKGCNEWLTYKIYKMLLNKSISESDIEINFPTLDKKDENYICSTFDIEVKYINQVIDILYNSKDIIYIPFVGFVKNGKISIDFKRLKTWASNYSW